MRSLLSPALAIALLSATLIGNPRADVNEPTWEPAVVVDAGAIDISSSNGSAMEHTPNWSPWSSRDEWHVVYAKAGEIYHAVLLPAGWQTPEALTSLGANASDPKLAFAGDRLILVWEDDRRGHPEIWCRMWDGSTWGPEMGLADDATPSRTPSIAGGQHNAFVVWQDGANLQAQIYGRLWDGAAWQAPANVSESPLYAIEPTVTQDGTGSAYLIAWTDARHGAIEIYLRDWWDGFGTPLRVTNLAGSCRRPSIHAEQCCGDLQGPHAIIAFENDQTGHAEAWTACYQYYSIENVRIVSPSDGRPSERPQVHGYAYQFAEYPGGVNGNYLVTWTEAAAPGEREHPLASNSGCGWFAPTEVFATVGVGTSAVAAGEGSAFASLLAAWLEEREGQRCLVIKRGSIPDCEGRDFAGPPAIVMSPGGSLGNTMTCTSACAHGEPIEDEELFLRFWDGLEGHLTWDVQQEHPVLPPQRTGPDGTTTFAVRGGGCWRGGIVSIDSPFGIDVLSWEGAKSPDVNGDCAVRDDDLAYVMSKLGTTDFCADLDGSGTVAEADVAIVRAAMGQLCSQLAGIGETTLSRGHLQVVPNPSGGEVTFLLPAGDPAPIDVEIFDAAGRLIRAWNGMESSGPDQAVTWDGRDVYWRDVVSGVYFVRARAGLIQEGRTFLITR